MNRRKLLAMFGAVPILGAGIVKAEGEMPEPTEQDIQAVLARIDNLQRQVDYKTIGNNPFVKSGSLDYGRILDRQTGVVDVASTSAETTLYTYTMQGNILYNNRSVRLEMYGDWLNNTGGNESLQLRAKLGTTEMCRSEDTTFLPAGGATRGSWRLSLLLSADSSLNAQQASFELLAANTGALTGTGAFGNNNGKTGLIFGTATEDALQPLAITVTVDWTTSSSNLSWRRQFASLELL